MVSKRTLLLIASFVWSIAGGILLYRGAAGILFYGEHLFLKFTIGLIGGVAFFLLLFKKISGKHIRRIETMERDRLPFYSFFSPKAYIMMILMISLGITIRKTGVVPFEYLSVFFVTMGLPLFLSALNFLRRFLTIFESDI